MRKSAVVLNIHDSAMIWLSARNRRLSAADNHSCADTQYNSMITRMILLLYNSYIKPPLILMN